MWSRFVPFFLRWIFFSGPHFYFYPLPFAKISMSPLDQVISWLGTIFFLAIFSLLFQGPGVTRCVCWGGRVGLSGRGIRGEPFVLLQMKLLTKSAQLKPRLGACYQILVFCSICKLIFFPERSLLKNVPNFHFIFIFFLDTAHCCIQSASSQKEFHPMNLNDGLQRHSRGHFFYLLFWQPPLLILLCCAVLFKTPNHTN